MSDQQADDGWGIRVGEYHVVHLGIRPRHAPPDSGHGDVRSPESAVHRPDDEGWSAHIICRWPSEVGYAVFVTVAFVSVGAALLLLLVTRNLVSPAGLLVVAMLPTMLGVGQLADRWGAEPAVWLLLSFPPIFVLGAVDTSRSRPARGPETHERQRGWTYALVAILPLIALHFSEVGIAALSATVEVQRFSLNSGYGGIPSRVVLFVLPILALGSAVAYPKSSKASVVAIWTTFVIVRVAMGFKSGLLEILILLIVVLMLRGTLLRTRSSLLLGVLFAGSWIYANQIATKYATIGSSGLSVSYLVDRMGRQSAEPAFSALELPRWGAANFFLNDAGYFFAKYFHLGEVSTFPVDQLISAIITGTPLSRAEFLVPVTVGGPSYLIGSLGGGHAAWSLVAIGAVFFVLGRVWRRVCRLLYDGRAHNPSSIAIASAALLALRVFVVNGGGVYVVINYAVAAAMAVLLLRVGEWIGDNVHGREPANVLVAPPNRVLAPKNTRSRQSMDP